MNRQTFVAAKHIAEMQSLPLKSLSATLKKRALGFFKSEINSPFSFTSLKLFSIADLGTLT